MSPALNRREKTYECIIVTFFDSDDVPIERNSTGTDPKNNL